MIDNGVRELISRTIDGVEALVDTRSGEIFLDVPASEPNYIRVREGDTVREGDIRSRTEQELESTSLDRWTIEDIGRETVVGTDEETGQRREWDRESLERRLAIGGLSATLTDFERVHVIGESDTQRREGRGSNEGAVIVSVYGNDGRKFVRTYRRSDEGSGAAESRLELVDSDTRVAEFEPGLQERFDRVVERALRDEGYAV